MQLASQRGTALNPTPTVSAALAQTATTTYVDVAAPAVSPTNPPAALPRVVINTTTGTNPTDTATYLDASITINGSLPYSGTTQIRGRGNTTWLAAKKPWRLKLTTSASLLGMPAERDWVLLANYFDPTSLRGALAFEMGARCPGLAWTPRFRFVELVLNGAFMGIYQLGEHVEISAQKINVTKASGTAGLSLTGAYTLEIDQRLESDPTVIGFRTSLKNIPVTLDDPDGTTAEHKTYIQNWMNTFEAALYSPQWLDPTNGYARFVDQASFIDWYLVNEITRNVDSNFFSSCKLYKARDTASVPGKLYMGPVWDFDRSLGFNNMGPTGWWTRISTEATHPGAVWIDRMMADPAFWSALTTRFAALRTSLATGDTGGAVIDRLTDRLLNAIGRDKRVWNYTADTPVLGDALRTWLSSRLAWLAAQYAADTTAPTTPTNLAGVVGNSTAGLTWTASTDDVFVARYRVRRGGTVIAEPEGTATNFTDTGLTNGTAYSYTLSALDPSGNESGQTASVSVTPSASADTTAPTAPTGFTATAGNSQVGLAWTASTDNVAVVKYRVRRGGTVIIAEPTATSYTATGLTNGTAYSFTVSAIDAAGNESAQSAAATATPTASGGAGPDSVATLYSWHKADSITGADGTAVTSWADSSGNSRTASQAGTNTPTLRTAQANGKPVLRFISGQALRAAQLSSSLAATTVFVVVKPAATGGFQPFHGSDVGGLFFGLNGDKLSVIKSGISIFGDGSSVVSTTSYTIAAMTLTPTDWAIYRNGAADGSGSTNGTVLDNGKATNIGASDATGGQPFVGDIAEMIVYSSALSTQDRATVTTYLATKYGITVS